MKKAVIIGGGFAGCTISYMLRQTGFDVTIVEASGVLGGGCRTFFYHGHPYTLGPRHLLVDREDVEAWNYFNSFVKLRELKHYCLTYVGQDDRFYSYPIHAEDVEEMPDRKTIHDELDRRGEVSTSQNFEEFWINSVGPTLYEKFINSYSRKMWQVRTNKELDTFKFSPKGVPLQRGSRECWQGSMRVGYPEQLDGYNQYFEQCVQGCRLVMNTFVEKFDLENKRIIAGEETIQGDVVVNTASLDLVFGYCYGELRYIGRDFLKVILPVERVTPEPYVFIYYAGDEPYLRVVEYKLLTGYQAPETLIGIESPSFNNRMYPYPIKSEIDKSQRYLDLFPADCYSIGRMGKYRYDQMYMVYKDCLELIHRIND